MPLAASSEKCARCTRRICAFERVLSLHPSIHVHLDGVLAYEAVQRAVRQVLHDDHQRLLLRRHAVDAHRA